MRITLVAAVGVLLGLGIGAAAGYWQYNSRHQPPKSLSPLTTMKETSTGGARPLAAIDETTFEFGSMEQGKSMTHEFVIFNRGTAPLKLEQGPTTCKCTLSELDNNVIEPGKSATVTLEWRAESGPGPFRQTATIYTDDPLRPEFELVVNGEITQGITITPTELVFTALPSNEPTSAKATILSFFADELEIVSTEFESDEGDGQFEVSYEPVSAEELTKNSAKSGVVAVVTSKPGLPLGPIRQKIILETNVEGQSPLELPVQGNVTSDISVIGPNWNATAGTLRMGLIQSSQGATQTLKLVTRGPHRNDIKFEIASKNPEFLEVTIGERTEFAGGAVTQVPITVTVPKDLPPVNHSGTRLGKVAEVQLKTNHPDVTHVPIRVQFVVED